MNKIELDNLEIFKYDSDIIVQFNIEPILWRFAIAITLLIQDFSSSITIWKSKPKLRIRLEKSQDSRLVCKIESEKFLNILLLLDNNTLDYIQRYLLRYIRDGVADVANFDINAPISNSELGEFTMVIQALSSIPPISPDEASKVLD